MKSDTQRCPHCGQPMLKLKPKPKPEPPGQVKEYALERQYQIKRRNGGFV